MNILMRNIKKYMFEFKLIDKSKFNAVFLFDKNFLGFKGHFIDNPILPGVCKVQAILLMAKKVLGEEFKMVELTSAKFFTPVTVGEELLFECSTFNLGDDKNIQIDTLITRSGDKIAKIRLNLMIDDLCRKKS